MLPLSLISLLTSSILFPALAQAQDVHLVSDPASLLSKRHWDEQGNYVSPIGTGELTRPSSSSLSPRVTLPPGRGLPAGSDRCKHMTAS